MPAVWSDRGVRGGGGACSGGRRSAEGAEDPLRSPLARLRPRRVLLPAARPRPPHLPPNCRPSLWARVGDARKLLPRPFLSHPQAPFLAAALSG